MGVFGAPNILFLVIVLVIAVITDLRSQKIPNWLTFSSMILGVGFHTLINGYQGLIFSMSGLFLGIAIFIPFYFAAGMGAGDVKLLGGIGAILGVKGIFMASIGTAITGGFYAIILLAIHGQLRDTIQRFGTMLKSFLVTRSLMYIPPEHGEKKPTLCYGLAIAIGTLVSIVVINPDVFNEMKTFFYKWV